MALRQAPIAAAISRGSALGIESVTGESAPITKRFGSFGMSKSPETAYGAIEIPGVLLGTKYYESSRYYSHSIEEGVLSYDEVVWALNGIVHSTVPTPVTSAEGDVAAGAYSWKYKFDPFAKGDLQTYTVQSGDFELERGGKAAGATFTEWGFSVARDGDTTEMSGAMISPDLVGGAFESVAIEDFVPVIPGHWNVYLDYDYELLGTTQVENAFNIEFSLGDRQSPVMFLNRAFGNTYAGTTHQRVSAEMTLGVADEADPLDAALLAARNGQRIYLRAEAVGPEIEPGVNYMFRFDSCCQISDGESEGDSQEAASMELSLAPVADSDLGGMSFTVVNELAELA